jgi:predicted small metal-binding protein
LPFIYKRISRNGENCDYVCKGETEEVMKNAEEHAMKDHGYKPEDVMTPELRDRIRSHIIFLTKD